MDSPLEFAIENLGWVLGFEGQLVMDSQRGVVVLLPSLLGTVLERIISKLEKTPFTDDRDQT